MSAGNRSRSKIVPPRPRARPDRGTRPKNAYANGISAFEDCPKRDYKWETSNLKSRKIDDKTTTGVGRSNHRKWDSTPAPTPPQQAYASSRVPDRRRDRTPDQACPG